MKDRLMSELISRGFETVRNQIEAEVQAPSVILITSATAGDGASRTAFGIAAAFASAAQRTVLVEADGEAAVRACPVSNGSFSVLSLETELKPLLTRRSAESFIQQLRGAHEYILIGAGGLLESRQALMLAPFADAVILSLCIGRQQLAADRAIMKMLERLGANVLGVVTMNRNTIREFNVPEPAVVASRPRATGFEQVAADA